MGVATFPAAAVAKTRYVVTLLSGTSWTVPAGCLYVNAKLFGGGGGGSGLGSTGGQPRGGQVVATNLATTPAASITYAIGAGGAVNAQGGSTTFTGATTAVGGLSPTAGADDLAVGTAGESANNEGSSSAHSNSNASAGGAGKIELEYWV